MSDMDVVGSPALPSPPAAVERAAEASSPPPAEAPVGAEPTGDAAPAEPADAGDAGAQPSPTTVFDDSSAGNVDLFA